MVKRAFVLLFAVASTAAPALAYGADHYDTACQAYRLGDMNAARTHFYAYLKGHPNVYQAHYPLANALLALGEWDLAKDNYEKVLSLNPDKKTAQYAREGLQRVVYYRSLPKTSQPLSQDERKAKMAQDNLNKTIAMQEEQRKRVQAQRDQIMKDAERQAGAVIAEAQSNVDGMKTNANYRLVNTSGDFVGNGVPTLMQNDITREAQNQADQIRRQAERRADALTLPGGQRFIGQTPGKGVQ